MAQNFRVHEVEVVGIKLKFLIKFATNLAEMTDFVDQGWGWFEALEDAEPAFLERFIKWALGLDNL